MDSPLYGYECCTFLIFANFEEITNTKTGAYIVNRFKSNKSMIINNNEIVIKPIQEEEGQDFQEMYGDVAEQNHTYEIGYLIGEEEFLNRGIGKRIIQILEDKITEIGGKEIAADPAEENIISIKTLLSNGFKKKNQTETTGRSAKCDKDDFHSKLPWKSFCPYSILQIFMKELFEFVERNDIHLVVQIRMVRIGNNQ